MRHTTQIHSGAILAISPNQRLLTLLRAVLLTPQGSNPKTTPAAYVLPASELARFRTAESDHSTPPKRRLDFTVPGGTPPSPHSGTLITSSPSSPLKARSAPTPPPPANSNIRPLTHTLLVPSINLSQSAPLLIKRRTSTRAFKSLLLGNGSGNASFNRSKDGMMVAVLRDHTLENRHLRNVPWERN